MPENSDTVSVKALGDLTNALSRLKAQGGALHGDKYWINRQDSALEYQQLDRTVEEYQSSLIRLKETRDTLSVLLRDVEQKLEAFRFEVLPAIQHHNFAKLPDEILGIIFELCGEEKVCNVVSYVCRRFRAIALKLPNLWARVSNFHSPAELRLRLARSGNRLLTVEFSAYKGYKFEERWRNFLEIVLEHKVRWGEFKLLMDFSLSSHLETRKDFLVNLGSMTTGLEVLSLTTLTIIDGYLPADECSLEEDDRRTIDFYWTWKLPSLSSLYLGGHVPEIALWTEFTPDLRWRPTITTVQFTSEGTEGELNMLLQFLNTQPNLRDLSVSLSRAREADAEEHNFEDDLFIANLPNLRSLSLTSHWAPVARKICCALKAPNVEQFTLHLDLFLSEYNIDAERDLHMLLMYDLKSVSLKTLSLAVDTKQPSITASSAILLRYDKLEHLVLEGPCLWPPQIGLRGGDRRKTIRLPQLRTLRLIDCPRMDTLSLIDFASAFATRSDGGAAGSIEILRNSGLRRGLEQSFLRDKVAWYERPDIRSFNDNLRFDDPKYWSRLFSSP